VIRLLVALALLILASGSAAAPPASGSSLREDDQRVARISYRLAIGARAFCPESFPVTGLLFHHLADYLPKDRPSMIARHGLNRGLGVLTVVEGSPAARAGLIAGDVVLAVNGIALEPAALDSDRTARDAIESRLEDQLAAGPAHLRLLRAGVNVEAVIAPERGCPSRLRLARSSQVNGFANSRAAVITTALLAETQGDDELAIVIGHELAHVALRHPDRLIAQGVPRGVLRSVGANAERVHLTEQEADRLGAKLVWAAGYDVRAAIPFWRRFYARYDGPQLFRTHPSLKLRERLIRETLAELEAGPERPELREGALRQR
jgi:hypothetical protein